MTSGLFWMRSGNYGFAAQDETSRLRFLADIYGYQTIDELNEGRKPNCR